MTERWKPEDGDYFWFINETAIVQCFAWTDDKLDRKFHEIGNCFRTKEEAHDAAEKVKALLLSLHGEQVTECNQLPKLTTEVFDRPDCPKWAKWAAVDKDGRVWCYEAKPSCGCDQFFEFRKKSRMMPGVFDSDNWQNSLIKRPAKALPDWCKVGEWCYCKDDDDNPKYFKITNIKDNYIYGDDWDIDYHHVRQARLRPYNAEEMRGLVGKVVKETKTGDVSFVTGFCNRTKRIYSGQNSFTTELLLSDFVFTDNAPCGVLEHLENGGWVK